VVLTPEENIAIAADKTVGLHSRTFVVNVPGSTPRAYYLLARMDHGNTVSESNESNNVKVVPSD